MRRLHEGVELSEVLQAAEERPNESLRVLIVDDHDLFRTGLRNLLEEQGVLIVGEAAAGAEAVRIVRELAPDVVVMDLNMPGMGGIEATRHITAMAPLTRVVMLTISEDDSDVMDAILAGACGYLLKDSSIQDLMTGIRAASRGESLISPNIAAKVLQRVRATSTQPEIANTIRAELSDREIEVLKLIANGKDNARHRRRAAHQPEDRQEPHLEHPHEAADRQPHPGGCLRRPLRNRLDRCSSSARPRATRGRARAACRAGCGARELAVGVREARAE